VWCSRLECAADIVVLVPGGLKGVMFDQDAKVLSQHIAVCCNVLQYVAVLDHGANGVSHDVHGTLSHMQSKSISFVMQILD